MEQAEEKIVAGLLDAQTKAQALFAEIDSRKLIRPGVAETEINESIYALAAKMYGITRYWHKRIVRAGRNTLAPYDENPPDLKVAKMTSFFLISVRSSRNGRRISAVPTCLEATL
jgi:Xaa-Pro dipeptidase